MSTSMLPLLVFCVGPGSARQKLCTQIRQKLRQRGLRVELLENPDEPLRRDCDVLLFPCTDQGAYAAAQQLEQAWTQSWATWYSSARLPSDGGPHARPTVG